MTIITPSSPTDLTLTIKISNLNKVQNEVELHKTTKKSKTNSNNLVWESCEKICDVHTVVASSWYFFYLLLLGLIKQKLLYAKDKHWPVILNL